MMGCYRILLLIAILRVAHAGDNAQEEEDLNYYLGKVLEEPSEETYNPHDMLNYPNQKQPKRVIQVDDTYGANIKAPDQESCSFDALKVEEGKQKLTVCQDELKASEHHIEVEKQKVRSMENRLLKDGSVDMKSFYRRLVHRLWSVLEIKEAQNILKDQGEAIIRRLKVRIGKEDISTLEQFLKQENNVQQVDVFLQDSMELEIIADDTQGFPLYSIKEWAFSITEVGKNVEVWLYILCLGFLLLGIWAIYLFIQDIKRELRWMRVIMMMVVLIFFICCLWHWRHMHKVAESRRHAQMMKRGFTDIPEECKPGAKGTSDGLWEWIKIRAFGAPDVCEKYFEEMMIDPSEEITPAMVIAETLAKFFLQPLQHLGSESAKFITNFYQNVPIVYHVPATLFFIVLLIIILFAFCGYGIDFPLWMGGIRPIYRTETKDVSSEIDRITREAVTQLQNDRERFMDESRMMLTNIAQAAASSQVQTGIQPLLAMSSGIIESQLERLIARQLSEVISQTSSGNGMSALDILSRQQSSNSPNLDVSTSQNLEVSTVTSTPLRKEFYPQRSNSSSGEDVRDSSDKGIARRNNCSLTETSPVMVVTDAVHYRLKGAPRKSILPPRNTSSTSSSSFNHTGETKSSTEATMDMSVRRRTGTKPNENVSLSSNLSGLEPFSSDDSGSGGNFFNKVKSILEDSANSSMNLDDSGLTEDLNKRISKSLNISQARRLNEEDEEIELSTSGVKFLNKIEKVMTP